MGAVALNAGHRQARNSNCVAAKRVSIVLALYWRWKSGGGNSGRPSVSLEMRELVRQMSTANPLWGAPRIHGELLKLGIQISQATVAKYMVHQRKPPSQTWRTFLDNHVQQLVAIDFLVVPTVSFRCCLSSSSWATSDVTPFTST